MIMRQKFQLRVLPSPLTKLDVNIKRMRSVSSLWMVWEWSSLSDVLTLLSCSLQLHCSLMPDIHDVEVGKKSSSGIRAKRSLSNPSITTSYASERRASVWRNLDCNRLSFNPTLILFGDERMVYELQDWDDHNERRRRAALTCDPQSCVAFDKQMNFSDSSIAFTWWREIRNRSTLSFLADRWHYQH